MQTREVDLFVIGAGSGGLAAAKRAASHGARVAIAEDSRVGGTCVIRGCIPKKLMVYAAQLGVARDIATDFGWAAAPKEFSWPRLCQIRDQVVNNLELAHQRHLAQAKVELVQARGRLMDPHTVEAGGQQFHAKHILMATGAHPVMPTFPGHELGINSDDFFEIKEMPRRVLVFGGGYIAVEFASLLRGLGAEVTLIVRSKVLREFDHDIRAGMVEAMRQRGISVLEGTQIERLERDQNGDVAVHVVQGDERDVARGQHCILFATGRQPNTSNLGLTELGVQLGEGGAIQVDAHHGTAVPSIHAIGDVTGHAALTPVAIRAGRTWADRTFGGLPAVMSYDAIPTAVFGLPPVAAVGLTEEQAQAKLGEDGVRIFKARFIPLLFSATPQDRKSASMMKLVVDAKTDRVLGCHMLGDDAAEIIQGFATAVVAGLTKAQLDATVAIHPTQAEEFVLMR